MLSNVLNNHNQERKLDSKSFCWVCGASDIAGGNIGANDFNDRCLDMWICNTFNVAIFNWSAISCMKEIRVDKERKKVQNGEGVWY